MATNQAKFITNSSISEDWQNGYKVELNLTAESDANNWELDFNLPYEITAFYGADLINNNDGSYTISGENDQVNLQQGQSIKPIFIIDDQGKKALKPEFDYGSENVEGEPKIVPTIDNELNNKQQKTPKTSEVEVETPFQSTAQTGKFAYGEALQKNFLFLEANRSGALGADNRLEWRQDSTTEDGSDVGRDLTGGYFDAGDHIKFIQPMAFSSTMLAWGGVDYKQAYAQSGQLDELRDAVKWGTDWFLKAHEMDSAGKTERLWVQVGDKTDHYHWVPPEEIANKTARPSFAIDRNRPGSDAAAGTASALASASMLFRGVDDAYADELLKNAEALYEFAETYKGKYSDSVPQASPFYTSWSGYGDELALGGAWLYRATGDSKYLSKAENYFKNNVGGLGDWSYATDDHSYGAATLLAKESSDPFFKNQTKGWLDTWVQGGGSVNYTNGGFAHRANWASVPVTMSTAFAAEWYNDHVEANSGYSDFANNQVDYVLGDNPANLSYVVGFGDKYPERTHHRGSAGSAPLDGSSQVNDHILYGAVVGGPESADDFSYNDRRNDWVTNEVGTSYNAPFAGAAVQQYENLGGDPLSESELDQLIGVDANGVGF
ncbi:MAG: glycoside hydrolase family 9 protein [Cyanobacteria bacterium P01_A01_bin.83]